MTAARNLIAELVQRNYDDYAATTQSLIESLTAQLAEANAEISCIRHSVEGLLEQRYAPSEHIIRRALYPGREYIKSFIPEGET